MDPSLSPKQLQQQPNERELTKAGEEKTIGTPKPIEDDDSHTTKKLKLDHSPTSPSSPPAQPPLASPSSLEQPQAMQVEQLAEAPNQHVGPIDNATSTPSMPPPLPSPSPSQQKTTSFQPPSLPLSKTTTADVASPVAKPPIHDSPVEHTAHSPETLEIISNEGSSPPPFAFANATGISPIQSKPRKQKPSRTASPSPYSFGAAANTNMTRDQIKFCGAIMRNLKKHRDATPFIHPVDYVKLKIPDYPQIIKHPMDLTTIDRKLQHGDYNDVDQFIADIRLLFNNCYKFNGPEAMVSMLCQNVESAFEKSLRQMPPSKESSSTHGSPDTKDLHHASPQATATSFRRISEDGRPKREIHPPPSKDYPETVTKQRRGGEHSAAVIKRRKADVQLKFCGQAIRELKKNKYRDLNYPFLHPVDAVALNIPDYHTIITHPMDISTIERNLNNGEYDSPESFESDVRLMFNNCYRYNPPALPVHKMAKELEKVFDEKWQHLPEREPTPSPPSPARRHSPPAHVITRKADSYTSSDDEDADGSEESDNDRDDRIAELERHIANISQQIASIKSTKKKDKSHSKSTSSPSGNKRKTPSSSRSSNSKKTSAVSSTSSTKDKAAPKSRRRPSAKQQPRKGSVHDLPEFTFEQKKHLSENINNLSGDRLNTVVSIIQSSMALDGEGQEEIVLDIDALDRKTLHRLHEFVTGESLLRKPISSSASHTKHTSKKQKSLESERRIRALEDTLKQFSSGSHHHHHRRANNSSSESDSDSSSGSDSDDSGSSTD